MALDTYAKHHIKVLLLANVTEIYNPLSFLFIKVIPMQCKQNCQ